MNNIKRNYPLKKYNSLLMNHKAQYFCEVHSKEESYEFIDFCIKNKLPIKILGSGTNVMLTKNIDGAVLKVSILGKEINGEKITLGAGENWHETVLYTLKNSLFGLENLSLIPGTAGAAPVQNIGAYGEEISSKLLSLEAIDLFTNEQITFENKSCRFNYRESQFKDNNNFLITSITLELNRQPITNTSYKSLNTYLLNDDIDPESATPNQVCRAVSAIRERILPDPSIRPNVGSFFKNLIVDKKGYKNLKNKLDELPAFLDPVNSSYKIPSAFLIEKAGWKGKKIGKVGVSKEHALVIILEEGASSEEVINFSSLIINDISEKYGVTLELEPIIF
tara:strand:- start:1078 stop:2085 length:1008 start_codon:yes stop_codon:yes gene_type:complete